MYEELGKNSFSSKYHFFKYTKDDLEYYTQEVRDEHGFSKLLWAPSLERKQLSDCKIGLLVVVIYSIAHKYLSDASSEKIFPCIIASLICVGAIGGKPMHPRDLHISLPELKNYSWIKDVLRLAENLILEKLDFRLARISIYKEHGSYSDARHSEGRSTPDSNQSNTSDSTESSISAWDPCGSKEFTAITNKLKAAAAPAFKKLTKKLDKYLTGLPKKEKKRKHKLLPHS